jgi:hypothetical protein
MTLSEMIGQEIIVMIPLIEDGHYQKVRLMGVEAGGVWIHSQTMINQVYAVVGEAASERTPVFFLPYHQIQFAIAVIPGLALNETAFGVKVPD